MKTTPVTSGFRGGGGKLLPEFADWHVWPLPLTPETNSRQRKCETAPSNRTADSQNGPRLFLGKLFPATSEEKQSTKNRPDNDCVLHFV